MGVQGLWQLLTPVGRPVTLESLEGKTLSVDVSIWLNQAAKGFRDSQGHPVPNSHVLGLFHRLCKLLFYKIKPVFVFDGRAPQLKKQTLAARQQKREAALHTGEKIGRKMLTAFLHSHLIQSRGGDKHQNVEKSETFSSKTSSRDEGLFRLPPLSEKVNEESEIEDHWETRQHHRNLIEEEFQNLDNIDVKSEDFHSLPPEVRHEILISLKERRRRGWSRREELPDNSQDFSKYQMSKLVHRSYLQKMINDVQKEMNAQESGEILSELYAEENIHEAESRRIISDDTSHYILIKKSKCSPKRNCINQSQGKESTSQLPEETGDKNNSPQPRDDIYLPDDEIKKLTPLLGWDSHTKSCVEPSSIFGNESLSSKDKALSVENDDIKEISLSQVPSCSLAESKLIVKSTFQDSDIKHSRGNIKNLVNDSLSVSCKESTNNIFELKNQEIPSSSQSIVGQSQVMSNETTMSVAKTCSDKSSLNTFMSDVPTLATDYKYSSVQHLSTTNNSKTSNLCTETWKSSVCPDISVPSSSGFHQPGINQLPFAKQQLENNESTQLKIHSVADVKQPTADNQLLGTEDSLKKGESKSVHEIVNRDITFIHRGDKSPLYKLNKKGELVEDTHFEFKEDKNILETAVSSLKRSHCDTISSDTKKLKVSDKSIGQAVTSESSMEVRIDLTEAVVEDDLFPVDIFLPDKEEFQSPVDVKNEDLTSDTQREPSQESNYNDTCKKYNPNVSLEELETMQRQLQSEHAQQERQAVTIADHMYHECQVLLRLFGVPYIVSPQEAEAQCAQLDAMELTQGTITDDSDIWLFGGHRVYKNFFNQGKFVEFYKDTDIKTELGLDRCKMISLALLTGSDYTEGVEGVGYVTAMEILSEFPGDGMDSLKAFRLWWDSVRKAASPPGNKIRSKLQKFDLEPGFPSQIVFDAYLYPHVDDSSEKFSWGIPDLQLLREYAEEKFGWSRNKIDDLLLPVMKKINERQTQVRINSFFTVQFTKEKNLFPSKRLQYALTKIRKPSVDKNEEKESDSKEKMLNVSKTDSPKQKVKCSPQKQNVKYGQVEPVLCSATGNETAKQKKKCRSTKGKVKDTHTGSFLPSMKNQNDPVTTDNPLSKKIKPNKKAKSTQVYKQLNVVPRKSSQRITKYKANELLTEPQLSEDSTESE
ncbi:rad2 superfamily protein mus201 isoform X1 [Tachypleus tridentatus]|uniref:rad2 superfamily protein mus201 isoform X1 n=2 Tax=Tachypleus tridentatus TaxID=6853 RepID=UPI003FD5C101